MKLRQSYTHKPKRVLVMRSRCSHTRQMRRARKEVKKLKTYLGRVVRDVERKVSGNVDLEKRFASQLEMGHRLFKQQRQDKNKLYSLHEVECISKGKAHKRYEFGCKVSVTTTSKDNFVVGAQALHGNPYDGHTFCFFFGDCSKTIFNPSTHEKQFKISPETLKTNLSQGRLFK